MPERRKAGPTTRKSSVAATKPARRTTADSKPIGVDEVVHWLKKKGRRKNLEAMARYGIPATNAVGVAVGELKDYARKLGRDHALAQALWRTGLYEARMLAAFVGEAEKLNLKEMKAWVGDFDSWAICDHCCFHLFDRSPLAWKPIETFARSRQEFVKRAAFALIWALSVHDKEADDLRFIDCLPIIERAATDERDLVKKAVDMALRAVGKRNRILNAAARRLAARLVESANENAAWIGRKSLRELESPAVRARLADRA
ncbi:MAG: DNA alkylation repair protein [Planctomycetes bacterium]|nr:DNA alkylation repair protein [Planctomycetota bacterium]